LQKESGMISDKRFAPIAALDLDAIKVKLMHQESGEGWSLAYADSVEFEYRRFLYLMKEFPNEQAAPLFDVDVFWHYHILDTMKYAADCQAVFGYFLHHFPYVGLRGEDDLRAHQRVGVRMRELYEQTYGERYIRQETAGRAATDKVAFSVASDKVAFSIATARFAPSPAAKFAFSVAMVTPDSLPPAVETAYFDAPVPAALFYTVRPTISRAVQV
jgi:hypothetical protein